MTVIDQATALRCPRCHSNDLEPECYIEIRRECVGRYCKSCGWSWCATHHVPTYIKGREIV